MSLLRTPADAAFSLCVRERAEWRCERCGSSPEKQGLHCAHVMSRGHWSVRFDPSNALSLCYGCHRITEQRREVEFIPLVIRTFGELEWDRVFAESKRPTGKAIRRQIKAIAAHYRAEHQRMTRYRDCGHVGRLEFEAWA